MTQANSTVLLLLQSSTERTRYREWLQSETSSQRVFIERSHQEFLVAQKTLLTANSAPEWCADIVIFDETIYESDWAQVRAFWEGWQPTFLILLETVDEDYSASVLTSGVHEYLLKSSLTGIRLRQTVKMLRKQAQLQQNLHICKHQDVFSQAAIGLNQADSEGRFIRVNQRFCDLLGYSETELLQLTYQEVTHPDDLEAQVSQERQLFEASLDNTTFEKRYLTKDGRSVWTRVTLSTIKDSRGCPISDLALVEDISDRKQLETQLSESEAELRGLFEAMDDVVVVLDRHGTYLKVAPCSPDNLFRHATDLLGQSVQDVFPAEQARAFLKHIQWVLDTQQTQEIEYCLMIQGAEHWFRAKCSPIAADQVIFVARNVTDRKQHEAALAASEAQFRSLVENASDITFALDFDGTLSYISPQVERILGYAPAELLGQSIGELPIHPEDVVAARQAVQQLMATGQPQRQAEMRWRHHDGHWHYLWGRLAGVCDPAGTLVSIQGLVTDIHAQRLAEQARDESRARFQAIYEQAAVGICLASTNSAVVLAANQWLCDFLGYSENELQQLTYRDYSHPDDQAMDDRLMARLIAGELPFFAVEKRLIHKSGEARWANLTISVVSGPDGQPLYNLAIVQDIRARKQLEICQQQAEIALQEQHDFLQTILDNLPVSLFVKDARPETFGQFVLANQVCERYFGRSQAEMIGHTDADLFLAADAAKYQAKDREVMTTRRKSQYEEIIDPPQIGRCILDTIKVPIYDSAGAPRYLLGISADITAYKQAQQALQEREAQLLEAQRLAHIGNWEFDLNTKDFICSPELLRICGFDNALASPTFEEFAACVHPDDWPELAAAIRRTRDDGTPHALSHRIVRPDGTLRQTFCKGQAVFNEQNQVVKLRGVSQDITEITAAELALQASERKHQALIRALPDLIMRMSRDGVFLDLFAASDMTVLGEPEAFVGRHIFDSDLPTDVSTRRMEYVGKALSTGELQVYEQTLFNGQYQVIEEVRILPSAPEEVLVIVRDITERKAAEKALSLANESLQQQTHQLQHANKALALALEELEAEQAERQIQYRELVHIREAIEIEKRRYQDLFNFAPDGYVVTDVDGVIQEANRAIAVLTGTEQSQLVGSPLSHFMDESDRSTFSDLLLALQQSALDTKLETEDLKLKSKLGGTIPVAVTGTAIVDEQATCLGSRWQLQDISDRKQVEQALQKSEEQLRLALDFGRIGIWDWDIATSRLVWNDITYEIFGYDPTDIELTYDTWLNAVHPDDRAAAAAKVATAIAEQQNVTVEYRIIRPDGSQRWIADCGHTLCDAAGTPVRAIGVVTDITERKQAELALQASERRYATLTENSPVGIFQTDTNGHCVYHNPRWCQLSGLSLEESLGPNWAKAVHPDDRERVATAWYESTVPQQAGFQVECRFRQPSGKILWIYAQATPLLDEQGTLLGYIGTVTDITERHQAEVALRESEAKFRQLADSIASVFFIHDARTRALLYASPAFETIWGIPCEVLHEHPHVWLDYVHPDDVDWLIAAVEALNFDVLSNAEYRIIRPDGEVRWLASRSFPITDAGGQVYRIAGVAEDISDRKATEAALQASEERLRTALEAAQMGSWDWNLATDEVIWSASLEKLMGLEPGTFDGDFEIAMNAIHPDDRQRVADLTTYSVQHGTPCYIEFRVVKANGEIRWLASRGNVFHDAHGQPIRMAGMDMDITDRKQAELSLQRTNALMGAINTAQTQFITDADPERLFDHLLETLLELTDSEYGLIAEVLLTADGEAYIDDAYLKTQGHPHQKVSALTDRLEGTAGHDDDEDAVPPEPLNLRSLRPLIKQVMLTQEPVIANHLAADDQPIHELGSSAPLRTFLGVPFHRGDQLVGLVGLANRTDGYDPSMFAELALFLNTCQSTIEAYRNETKRRQAEQALQQLNEELEQRVQRRTAALTRSEADLRTIFNNVYDAIFIHDLDGKILDVNDRSLQLFGATREQLLPLSIKELSAPESPISQIPELLNRALNGEVLRFEWKIRRYADPVTLDAEVSLRCVELGNRSVIIAGVQNISDRKQAEAALQESRNMLKLVLDAIPQRVFWKDHDSRFLGCNPAFANDFQITAAEILGKTDAELPWAADAERYRAADAQVMSTGIARVNYEETLINGYGELTWIRTSRVPLTNAQGNVIGVLVCYEDITERKWAEQQLEAERLRLQVALEAAQMGTWESDLETEFWSTQTEAIFGYAPGTFPGDYAAFLNLVHPDDRERVFAASTQSFAEQGAHTQEYRIQRLDGRHRWVAVQSKVVANEAGTGDRLIGVIQDITDRKQAEAALRDSEARFRQIAENIQEVFWLTTVEHKILYVSSAYAQVWGRSPDTVTTDTLLATIFPDDRDRFLSHFRWAPDEPSQAILAGEAELEYRITRPDGEVRWIRDRAFPVTDDQGRIIRIAGVAEDITERKRLEQEQARLLRILEASPDHIGMATPEGKIIWNNQQGRRIRGLPLNADATQFSMETYHPQWALEILLHQAIPTAIKEGIWVGETALLDAKDEEIPVSQLVLAHKSDTGEIEYLSTIIRDISSLKAAERALRRSNEDLEARVIERTADYLAAKDAAEAANRAKSTFFANMSHELRTPLNAILGFSQLMGRDLALSTKHLEELKIINRSGEHLLNLINDILEMSKIEAGQVTLTATNFKLHQMLLSLADMLRLKAEAKNLQFTITLHPQLPRYIRTDGHKLRQVLLNLLSNAIKFTQTGYVVLRVGLSRPKPLTNHDLDFIDSTGGAIRVLNFQVEDSGMGIAAEELDLLFEPFVQTRSGRQSQEGTGLGLPISRQFVDLLGGDFEVTSEPNVGSTFAFEIPVQVMTAEAVELTDKLLRAIALAPDQPTYRILVVEDDWANRVLLQNLLTDLGFVVQTAVNGQAAIERWQAWHPDLIFMDIRMPEMNGYEATQAIRRLEQATQTTTRPTKIICLTAGIFETDQPEFVAIGFDDYICKPIQETIITQSIARHLGVRYLYAPDLVKAKAIAAAPPLRLTDELLQALPLDWLQQFQTAITHLSQERMLALIADLSPEHDAIAQLLEEKVHDFDYEVLLNLTQMVLDA